MLQIFIYKYFFCLKGITAPSWIKDTMVNTIGRRETEKALQLGKVYTPQQAEAINLVDELVPQQKLLASAEEQMKNWCRIPSILKLNIIF